MRLFADPIVDWAALGKVIGWSAIAGIGGSLCFAFAVLGATRFADMRRNDRPLESAFYAILGLLGLAATIASIVIGIAVMTQKS